MFQINAMSREPAYEQIIHQVEQFILTDVLQPEAQIPSVRSVSMTNSINPRTILKAYTELDARGLIQSVPGKGYYVCADAQQKLLEKGREKMKDLTEMLTALAMAGVTKEEITACVEQAFTEAKELQKGAVRHDRDQESHKTVSGFHRTGKCHLYHRLRLYLWYGRF